jgi:hypothetical protein
LRVNSGRGTRDFIETAWHDPEQTHPRNCEGYQNPLQIENWDKALWYLTVSSRESGLAERIANSAAHARHHRRR